MAVRVGDTIKPMNNQNFPVVEATDITMIKVDRTTVGNLQQMLYDGELGGGGMPDPVAAGKIFKSAEVDGEVVWTQVDANNTQLANGAGYQTSSQVESAISTAMSGLADVATSGDYGDLSNTPTSLSQFDNTTTNFQSESQVQALIAAAGSVHIEIVQQLPATGQSNILYLVPKSSQKSDVYDEYIWVDSITPQLVGNYNLAEEMPELLSPTGQHVKATGITASEGSIAIFDSGASAPWFTYSDYYKGYLISITLTKSGGGASTALSLRYKTTDNNFDSYNGIPAPVAGIDPSTVTSVTFQNKNGDKTATVQLHLISKWEKIGSTEVDLSNYYTKTQTDSAIAGSVDRITYTNTTTASANTVNKALTDLYSICDSISASITPQIKTFTKSVDNTYEVGQTVSSIDFNWTYNKAITSQTLTDCTLADASVRTATYSTPLTSSKTFTLSCTDSHSQTTSSSLTVNFLHKAYYGSAAIPSDTSATALSAFLLALSGKTFKSNYPGSYPVTIASGEYGFFACPASWNPPSSCKIGGFQTDLVVVATFDFTNASGNTTSFKLLRTNKPSLGSTTMVFD